MHHPRLTSQPLLSLSFQRRGLGGGLLALALLAGCGGGGSDAAVGTGGGATVASYALGPITGYGSIVVNGVHYNEKSARVFEDDVECGACASALKLGMVVEIQGGAVDTSTSRANAATVRFGSELKGPVSAVDTSGGLITLLDQTVAVSSSTVWDSSLTGGITKLAELLAAGPVLLEVHAQFNSATGQYLATRIELETSLSSYKLRGTVASLDTVATTFKIGNAIINYGGIPTASRPANLADGLKLRVRLATAQVNGQWVATTLSTGVRKVEDSSHAHLRGTIGTVNSPTSFTVDGITVDASNASWPDGTTGLVAGARVEVEGAMVNGVLVATKVEFDSHHSGDDDDRNKPEIDGTVSAVDTSAKTFQIEGRSETISYAGASFKDGTVAKLLVGAVVEVKARLASDGSLVAKVVEFKS
ncbi:hypothetical protein BurJ1DRAFT_1347 [Burkholderiales bacterium JOSHI_001]|nr:hypothetical protein BurJ1DRAFT_1347 [Burkholderiales bacterium JOSHI_001]